MSFKHNNYGAEGNDGNHQEGDDNIPLQDSKVKPEEVVMLSKDKDYKKEGVSKKIGTNDNSTYLII